MAHDFAARGDPPGGLGVRRDGIRPQDVLDMAGEVGLMNVHVPEAYGGPELSRLDGCLLQ